MNTIKFNINGTAGEAQILEPNDSIIAAAKSGFNHLFENNFPVKVEKDTKVLEIGTCEEDGTTYKVYESYIDSGSVDYLYFATPYFQK